MKLFLASTCFLIAITAVAPFAPGQTLYWVGGTNAAASVGVSNPATDHDFNTAENWSTVPPNTFPTQTTAGQSVPGPGNVAVIDADVNSGLVIDGFSLVGGGTPSTVTVNQTVQGNTVQGFIVSNHYFVSSGTVALNNSAPGALTINGISTVGGLGDFVVDGGTTFNYTGFNSPALTVNNGLIVVGDNSFANIDGNTPGKGTFNINSSGFTFDSSTGGTTQMIVG
jgi:hypothetical protein